MAYLLKVTIIWSAFLLLFDAMYKRNKRFGLNRAYLLLSLAAGLLIPLLRLPAGIDHVAITANKSLGVVSSMPRLRTPVYTAPLAHPLPGIRYDWAFWLRTTYWLGVGLLVLQLSLSVVRLLKLKIRSQKCVIYGHEVLISKGTHTPFSFAGLLFIANPALYTAQELQYIIRHESVHQAKRHWIDTLLLQLLCIGCWFHPLVWRYRYLVQLAHEYEADAIAAQGNAFDYGHFLLRQIALKGVPLFASSFHRSPIKNRIMMLTNPRKFGTPAWRYVLALPVLISCSLLMAATSGSPDAEPHKDGGVTRREGNEFKWHTVSTGNLTATKYFSAIYEMNGAPVLLNEGTQRPASFTGQDDDFIVYLQKELAVRRKKPYDPSATLTINNIVVNKEGKIVYYELRAIRPSYQKNYWQPFGDQDPLLQPIVEKIIADSPRWKPALANGIPVSSFIHFQGC